MKTQKCTSCGVEYPKTEEFFYHSKNKQFDTLRNMCKECFRKSRRVHFKKHGRARKVDLNPSREPVVYCPLYSQESKSCQHTECRYHMGEFKEPKYSCLWEVTSSFENGLSYIEIAGMIGLTDQRVMQIERAALAKLKKRMKHLEIYNVPEPDMMYRKPEPVLNVSKISERKIKNVWHQNFYVQKEVEE